MIVQRWKFDKYQDDSEPLMHNQSLQMISKPFQARRILLIILKNKPWKKIKPGY